LPEATDGEGIDGDEETEETGGGGRQRDATATEAEEEDVAREVKVTRRSTRNVEDPVGAIVEMRVSLRSLGVSIYGPTEAGP
jgi:hypothetical protein